MVAAVTQAKNPEVGLLDRDRTYRLMMAQGSKQLLDTLVVRHPKIIRHLRSLPNAQPVADADGK